MPGMLTALAAVITAVAGLLATLKPSDKAAPAPPDDRGRTAVLENDPGTQPVPIKNVDVPAPLKGNNVHEPGGTSQDFDLVSVTPNVTAPLPVGRPVDVAISFRYRPAAPPGAAFGVYLEEFPPGDATCSGNVHHTHAGKLVPVAAGAGALHVTLKWQRRAGDTYKNGGPADHGFLSVGGNLWQDSTGRAGSLIHAFGTSPAVCIPYG